MLGKAEKFISTLDRCKTISIICHISPDGDTVGSGLALFEALKMYGKQPYIFCDDEPSKKLLWLPASDNFNKKKLDNYDMSICVDCSDAQRMGKSSEEYNKASVKVTIDHHKTNDSFSDINFIDPNASATAEIIFALIEMLFAKRNLIMSKDIATLLYSGIVTDSGCFTFSSVSANTFLIGAKLISCGIDAESISYHLTKSIDKKVFALKNLVLSKTKFYFDDKIAVVYFGEVDFSATNTDHTDTEGMINNALNVEGVEIALSITEVTKTQYKVSFRTKHRADASRCAMVFGGGGHKNAAGCRLNGCYEDVLEKLLKVCIDSLA